MRIGELQSEVFDWRKCIFEDSGEVYENQLFKLMGVPLDTGRLFYAKLRNAGLRNVEVYWNHFDNELTGVMSGRESEFEVSFRDPIMCRSDKVIYIETIVQEFKGRESWQQSLSLGAGQQDSSALKH